MNKILSILTIAIGMMASVNVDAQESPLQNDTHSYSVGTSGKERCRFIDLWSWRVNAVDFLATVPNAGLEVDLSRSPYNRLSLGADVRYRWNYRNKPTNYLMNIFDVKPELKFWWRGPSISRIAWYVGAYGEVGKYDYKLGKSRDGKDGRLYGAGAIAGFSRPLYQYRHCALDLEVGLSAGFLSAKYDRYAYSDNGYYVSGSEDWHILPYPVVPQLRVAFVLRSMSVNDKYRKVREQKIVRRQERRMKD